MGGGGEGYFRKQWQIVAFQEAVVDYDLFDLGYHMLPYMWDNRQDGNKNVKARLDRAMGDSRFLNQWGDK